MEKSFQEQLEILKNRLSVVPLSKEALAENPHLELVQDFMVRPILLPDGSKLRSSLQDYIRGGYQWEESYVPYRGDYIPVTKKEFVWPAKGDNDSDRNRIFLVIDNLTEEVAFYFGLSCGLIIDAPDRLESKSEETLVDTFLNTYKIKDDETRETLSDELYQTIRNLLGAKEARRLRALAESEYGRALDRKMTGEHEEEVLLREDTFPAIELTHFVKNMDYRLPKMIDEFSIGEYVFWELILDKIESIKEETGLQYMYLFAADPDMKQNPIEEQQLDDMANSGILTSEEAAMLSESITGKLVSYYRNVFGFRIIEGKQLVKPAYDYSCYSMFTPIQKLEELKNLYWKSLDTSGKRNRKRKK